MSEEAVELSLEEGAQGLALLAAKLGGDRAGLRVLIDALTLDEARETIHVLLQFLRLYLAPDRTIDADESKSLSDMLIRWQSGGDQ